MESVLRCLSPTDDSVQNRDMSRWLATRNQNLPPELLQRSSLGAALIGHQS